MKRLLFPALLSLLFVGCEPSPSQWEEPGHRAITRGEREAQIARQREANNALMERELANERRSERRAGPRGKSRADHAVARETSTSSGRGTFHRDYQGTLRDGSGRITGSSSSFGDSTTYRDGSGRITGMASKSPSGTTTYRDGSGRITGNASTFEGNTTFRDGSGRISGTASVSGDTTTYRDGNGRITGTAYKSPTGTITYRDANGRIVGTSN